MLLVNLNLKKICYIYCLLSDEFIQILLCLMRLYKHDQLRHWCSRPIQNQYIRMNIDVLSDLNNNIISLLM